MIFLQNILTVISVDINLYLEVSLSCKVKTMQNWQADIQFTEFVCPYVRKTVNTYKCIMSLSLCDIQL